MSYYGANPANYAMQQNSRRDKQFQNILNMFMQMKMMKEQRADKKYTRGRQQEADLRAQQLHGPQMERQKALTKASLAQAERAGRPTVQRPSAIEQKYSLLGETDLSPEQRAEYAALGRPPRPRVTKPTRSPKHKGQVKFATSATRRIDNAVKQKRKSLGETTFDPTDMTSIFKQTSADTPEIKALGIAGSMVSNLYGLSEERELTKEEYTTLKRINSAVASGYKFRTATNPNTGERILVIGPNKWITIK